MMKAAATVMGIQHVYKMSEQSVKQKMDPDQCVRDCCCSLSLPCECGKALSLLTILSCFISLTKLPVRWCNIWKHHDLSCAEGDFE